MEISGDVTDAGQTNERTNEQTLKIELLSQWKLEAEFRKNINKLPPYRDVRTRIRFDLGFKNEINYTRLALTAPQLSPLTRTFL